MGLALVVGVATKIVVEKENYIGSCTREDVLKDLKDELNLDLYDIEEDEENVYFYIKEDIFVNNIYNLLLSETKGNKWNGNEKERFKLILEKINDMDSVEKIKNIIKEEGSFFCI